MARWVLAIAVVAVAAVVVAVVAGVGGSRGRGRDQVGADLRALQRAADANGGTRAAGTGGDRATATYLAARLQAAGYRVRAQRFRVPLYRELRPPRVEI